MSILNTAQSLRGRCESDAAQICKDAQASRIKLGDRSCTDGAIAVLWKDANGKPLQASYVAKFFDPASGAAITLRDVKALPKELARDILMRALASLDEGDGPAARDTLDRLAIETGAAFATMMSDLADNGVVDEHDRHAANFARIAGLATRGHIACNRRAEAGAR